MPLDAQRILVYGVTGSGKTTLARRISERTGIPWHSVDDIAWLPGWVNMPDDEQTRRFEEICSGERWIMDTAYGKWLEIPLQRADLIVALDYPRWFSLQRLIRRSVMRAIDKRPVCNGNIETWRNMFSRDSIILWHFRSFARKRQRIRNWSAQSDGPKTLVFRSQSAVEQWLETIS